MSLQPGVALPLSLKDLQRQSLPSQGGRFVYFQRRLYRPCRGNTSTLLLIWQRLSFSSFVIGLAGKLKEEQELWEMDVCSSARWFCLL